MSEYGKCDKCGTDLVLAPGIDVYCPNKKCVLSGDEVALAMKQAKELVEKMNPLYEELQSTRQQLKDAVERLEATEEVIIEALSGFKCTQNPKDYPETHWSRKAETLAGIDQ